TVDGCRPGPLGQLDGNVLGHVVPPGCQRRTEGRRHVVGGALGLGIRDQEDAGHSQPGQLVGDRANGAHPEDDPCRPRLVGEPHAATSARRATGSVSGGVAVVPTVSATWRCQPVAAWAASIVTPGWTSVSTSSNDAGSGRSTPRSVMTAVGPLPRNPSFSRVPGPSPNPTEVRKSHRSTNV